MDDAMTKTTALATRDDARRELPPVLLGRATPAVERQIRSFYSSVAEVFERWVARRESPHTRRAYRQDVMAFCEFAGIKWPDDATRILTTSVVEVQDFRDRMVADGKAPKTVNRRIASLSSFYKYLQGVASEFRLPITVPNPAHAQFIPRGSSDPRDETKALSATRARQLMGMPSGDTVLDYRDRAIVKFFLYSGARIGTGCRLKVKDFHQDGDEATITLHEKGDKHRRIGLHFAAAEAIGEYIQKAGLTKGPLFRAQRHSKKQELGAKAIGLVTMYNLLQGYLTRLPGSMHEEEIPSEDGAVTKVSGASTRPTRMRATTATLLLDAGVDIIKVKELLGSSACDDDADLRQAAAESQGGGLARRADLTPPALARTRSPTASSGASGTPIDLVQSKATDPGHCSFTLESTRWRRGDRAAEARGCEGADVMHTHEPVSDSIHKIRSHGLWSWLHRGANASRHRGWTDPSGESPPHREQPGVGRHWPMMAASNPCGSRFEIRSRGVIESLHNSSGIVTTTLEIKGCNELSPTRNFRRNLFQINSLW
jgi:site-specific recombinase XerD